MKIYLIAPKNPESFWTFDRILPSLGKRCVFPNLALPTVAALTPAPHEVTLCAEELTGHVDVLFVGEAEYMWPQFVRDYETGTWPSEYRQEEKPSMLDS